MYQFHSLLGPKRADLNAMLDNLESSGPAAYANEGQALVQYCSCVRTTVNLSPLSDSVLMPKEDEESTLGLGELAELNSYSAINNDTDAAYDVRPKLPIGHMCKFIIRLYIPVIP